MVKGCRTGGRPIFEVPCWIGGPSCSVGGVECVELITAEWNIGSIEVHNVTNHYRIVCFWKRHRPSRAISARLVDERRSDVHVGIVGPRVVLWDVFERTRSFVVDGDVDGCRGRATVLLAQIV